MKPRTDQIRFISSANGQIVLDAYIEAAEKGGRSLGDLLADIFDTDGLFRTDIYQFRENPLLAGQLQARIGDFADPNAGWTNITSTSFQAFVNACNESQLAAAASASSAAASATTANTHKNDAQTARTGAESARDTANTHRIAAETAKTLSESAKALSESARDLAQKWASENEDVVVSSGLYSARHHASKALASSVSAGGSAASALTSANTSTTKAGEASTSAGNANSAKVAAEAARDLALSYRDVANVERLAAEAARDMADSYATASAASEGVATTRAGEASASAAAALVSQTLAATKAGEASDSADLAQGYADIVNPTNFYTKAAADTLLGAKANQATTYTKTEVDAELTDLEALVATKADQATTYTKTEVEDFVAASGGVPIGASIMWNRSDALPPGFLVENGAAISRTTYAALFAEIGTTYGNGNGSTTFNLPDSRGEFIRGLDEGRGVDTGRDLGVAQGDAIRNITGGMGSVVASSRNVYASPSGAFTLSSVNNGAASSATGSFGGSSSFSFSASRVVPTAAENRPRNQAKRFLIRAF